MTQRCPTCGQPSVKILATRSEGELTRRRHTCIDDHRWNTYEISETVARAIGLGKITDQLQTLARGIKARQSALSRRELILHLHAKGSPRAQIAAEAGCTTARVQQILSAQGLT